MRRINFKTFLFVTSMVGLVGCENESHDFIEASKRDIHNYVKSSNFKIENENQNVYKTEYGNCYLHYRSWREGSVSQVDCRDFGMGDSREDVLKKEESDMMTELLKYIDQNCVVYNGFPRASNANIKQRLEGRELSCTLPKNIDNDINERKLYENLKKKYGDK